MFLKVGHRFLYETFKITPKYSWEIDPFGASSVAPVLYAMMGFNAHVISRIDVTMKKEMQIDKSLDFNWLGSNSLPESRQKIRTHLMDEFGYCTPWFTPVCSLFFLFPKACQ